MARLTVAEAAAKIAAGAISAAEYSSAWCVAAASDELNAYLWTAEHGGEGQSAQFPHSHSSAPFRESPPRPKISISEM